MPSPITIAELRALLPKPTDDLCELIVKAGQFDAAFAAIYDYMFNEDGTFTATFQTDLCGACTTSTTTTTTTGETTLTTSTSTTTTSTSTSTTSSTTTTTTTPQWFESNSPNAAWSSIATNDSGEIAIAVAAGSSIPFYVSSDVGLTWDARGSSQFYKDCAMDGDGVKMYVVGRGGIVGKFLRSSDGGLTFSSQNKDTNINAVACTVSGSEVLIGTDVGVYRSTDSGATLGSLLLAKTGIPIHGLCISKDDTVAYVLDRGVANKIYISTDAPRAVWTLCAGSADITDTNLTGVSCSVDGAIVVVTGGNTLWLSTNSGASFSQLSPDGFSTYDNSTSDDGQKILVAHEDDGYLMSSTNGGSSFITETGIAPNVETCTISPNGLWKYAARLGGKIYVTEA